MSRIGKHPIAVANGVAITVDDHQVVTVKGPKGTLSQRVSSEMLLEQKDGQLTVTRKGDSKQALAR